MSESRDYVDARYWQRVKRASRMKPEERVAESVKLSETVVLIMCDAVRQQMPGAREEDVMEAVQERVNKLRALARRT